MRRRGGDVDSPRRRVVATPRPRRRLRDERAQVGSKALLRKKKGDIEDVGWLHIETIREVAPRQKHRRSAFEIGVFRPPSEGESLLVRVTRGCQWNKCTYCNMYRHVEFSLRHVDDVLQDVDAAADIYDVPRAVR